MDFTPKDELIEVANRIKPLGWHVVIYFELGDGGYSSARKKNSTASPVKSGASKAAAQPAKGRLLTQHTGLPPRKQK